MSEPDWLDELRRIQGHIRAGEWPTGAADAVAEIHEDERLRKIRELAEHGATPGERAAARAALHRIAHDAVADAEEEASLLQEMQDAADEEEAAAFGAL